jgi:hypothetical protein
MHFHVFQINFSDHIKLIKPMKTINIELMEINNRMIHEIVGCSYIFPFLNEISRPLEGPHGPHACR